MAVDIVVHPTIPEDDEDPRWLEGGYRTYSQALANKIVASSLAISIGDRSWPQRQFDGRFKEEFGRGEHFDGGLNSEGEPTGFLFGTNLSKAVKRIKEAEEAEVRVHGCYIGHGLTWTAVQLAAALQLDTRLFTGASNISQSGEKAEKLAGQGAFELGTVRFGEVLVYPTEDAYFNKNTSTGRLTDQSTQFYPLEAQFVDANTTIHHLG